MPSKCWSILGISLFDGNCKMLNSHFQPGDYVCLQKADMLDADVFEKVIDVGDNNMLDHLSGSPA